MRFPRRIFYGWWILAAGFATLALVGAVTSYGIALFIVPLTNEFGWSRTALATALSLGRLEAGLLGPVEGLLVDRRGPRAMMLFGIPLAGIGLIALYRLDELTEATGLDPLLVFYLVYVGMVTLGVSFGTTTAVSTAVANWFVRRRGLALGILSSGHGVGAAVWVPVLGLLIQQFGWRPAMVAEGAAFLLFGLPAAFVIRHRPEPYGYRPDGDPPRPVTEGRPETPMEADSSDPVEGPRPHRGERNRVSTSDEPAYTTRQALATRAFWMLGASFSLRVLLTNAVQVHLAALLQDRGMRPVEAAAALSALAGLSVVGRTGLGWLGDLLDRRRVYIGALAFLLAGLAVLFLSREPVSVFLFLALYAPAYGGLASLPGAIRGEIFGRRSFGAISGAMGPITTMGTLLGPLYAGYVFDSTGSYQGALVGLVACGLVSMVLMLLLKRPKRPEQVAGSFAPTEAAR